MELSPKIRFALLDLLFLKLNSTDDVKDGWIWLIGFIHLKWFDVIVVAVVGV